MQGRVKIIAWFAFLVLPTMYQTFPGEINVVAWAKFISVRNCPLFMVEGWNASDDSDVVEYCERSWFGWVRIAQLGLWIHLSYSELGSGVISSTLCLSAATLQQAQHSSLSEDRSPCRMVSWTLQSEGVSVTPVSSIWWLPDSGSHQSSVFLGPNAARCVLCCSVAGFICLSKAPSWAFAWVLKSEMVLCSE